jgi:GIY-YIG catalytic domain
MENYESFIVVEAFLLIIIMICVFIFQAYQKKKIRSQITMLANNTLEMTPEEFFKMRNKSFGGKGKPQYSANYNFAGVYILLNKTKNLYYVGQAQQVLDRVNNHFTGKGNGDVYADYKYGDAFTIKLIALANSQFLTLNALERNTIAAFNSYAKGYNKTRGNR